MMKVVRDNMCQRYNRVLFIGSKESGLKVLKKIYKLSPESLVGCVTVDDSDDSRSEFEAFQVYCDENSIELDVLTGRCDLTESINRFRPEICFVMGWYYIIPKKLIDKIQGGFIGIHNSLLPAHRGFAPVVWAMIAGDNETGVSVFSFDEGMDTGEIWYQSKVKIRNQDYISDVLKKLDDQIDAFFDLKYMDILLGNLKPKKQVNKNVSYGARRTIEDGKIDWTKTATEIYNFIRAQSKPYPGAYTSYMSMKVTVWSSKVFPHMIQGSPGQVGIINVENNEVVIVCGNSTGIVLDVIEVNGEEIAVTEMIKSLNYKIGN